MSKKQEVESNDIKIPVSFFVMRWIEFLPPLLFVVGVLFNIPLCWFISGLIMTFYDIMDLISGELKPTFPIIAAIIGASVVNPWYLGIFWSLFIFHILGVPQAFLLLISKKRREDEYSQMERRNFFNSISNQ